MMRKKTHGIHYMAMAAAVVCGLASLFFSLCNDTWSTLAQVLAQLCSAGLVAATLFSQYRKSREERQQYYADRNNEEFLRYAEGISTAVNMLQLTPLQGKDTIVAESAIVELTHRYESIEKQLSAITYTCPTDESSNAMVGEAFSDKQICEFYGITQQVWTECHQPTGKSIKHTAMSLLMTRHQSMLFCLFSSYFTINYFLLRHPSYHHGKEDNAVFLLSKFSIEHLRFFSLWADYRKQESASSPTLLQTLLQKVNNIQ